MAKFKDIASGDSIQRILNIKPGEIEGLIKDYNKNNETINQRIKQLQSFSDNLADIVGSRVADSLAITNKVAAYSKFTDSKGYPRFPEVEYEASTGKIKNKETGKVIKSEELQRYIFAQDGFYNSEESESNTKLSGVNGVYWQAANYINLFLRPEDRIKMKAYRFQGSTRERALKDIKGALVRLTDRKGDYKLPPRVLDATEFWKEWTRFKENYGNNVYRSTNNKMEDVSIFARDFYIHSKQTKKDDKGRFIKSKSPAELLRERGYKNFADYLRDN